MVSFGFKRSCPSVKSPSAAYPTALVPIEVGQRYETDGAALRKRWGALTTEVLKVPHFPSKPRPTCVVIAPHFQSESVPHFARNPHQHRFFEAPPHLAGQKIEVRFDPLDLSQLEIYAEGQAQGMARLVDAVVNGQLPARKKEDR
jgi:Mu transposase, C-terminal